MDPVSQKENIIIAIDFRHVAMYHYYYRNEKVLNNTNTLFDELREFLDVGLPYKPVIKNE